MLKKTVTYTSLFADAQVTEDHYFHISKADLIEMEMEDHKDAYTNKAGEKLDGIRAKLSRIVETEDGKAIIAEFKDMILRSYGKREGDRFLKSQTIRDEFESSEAFSQVLWELCTSPEAAADFMNSVLPSDLERMAEDIRKQVEAQKDEAPVNAIAAEAPTGLEGSTTRVLTHAEAVEMDRDELASGLATGRYKLSA